MNLPNLNVINTTNQLLINKASQAFLILRGESNVLQITRSDHTLLVPQTKVKILSIGRQGPQGLQGLIGPQGPPGADGGIGLMNVVEDLSPELGGDLMLNGFQIRGTVNNSDFFLDCGLI